MSLWKTVVYNLGREDLWERIVVVPDIDNVVTRVTPHGDHKKYVVTLNM